MVFFWFLYFLFGYVQFNAVSVYGVILTVIIGILFGYRFVGSVAYQVCFLFSLQTDHSIEQILPEVSRKVWTSSFIQNHRCRSQLSQEGVFFLYSPHCRMQMAEEERRVMMDMTSLDMENNQINAAHLVLLKFLFHPDRPEAAEHQPDHRSFVLFVLYLADPRVGVSNSERFQRFHPQNAQRTPRSPQEATHHFERQHSARFLNRRGFGRAQRRLHVALFPVREGESARAEAARAGSRGF